jgi:ABC-type amino acid transport substrate-binding protein
MTGDYLPFTYLDKATSKFRGFDVDMADALGRRAPPMSLQRSWLRVAATAIEATGEAGAGTSIDIAGQQARGLSNGPHL